MDGRECGKEKKGVVPGVAALDGDAEGAAAKETMLTRSARIIEERMQLLRG